MASVPSGHIYNQKYLRNLETPEGINLSLEIASYGTRVGAFLLDMLMIWGIMLVAAIIFGLAGGRAGSGIGENVATTMFMIIFYLLNNFWFTLFEMGPKGATPGKRVTRLRVVARDGGKLAASSIVTRNLMRSMEGLLPIFYVFAQTLDSGSALAGFLSAGWILFFTLFPLFNKDRMRVGDLLAGTWVIRVPKYDAGYDLTEARVPEAERFQFSDEQLSAYGAYELQTLEGVLRGRDNGAAAVVAETIRNKIGWPYEYDDRAFLTAYYNAVRARLERGMLFGKRKVDKFDQ
jgi:uncharacterized RDD family membrane protein YckC